MTLSVTPMGSTLPWTARPFQPLTYERLHAAIDGFLYNPAVQAELRASLNASAAFWRPGVGELSRRIAQDAADTWARNGARLEREGVQALQGVIDRFVCSEDYGSIQSLRILWDAIPYATSHTAYPQIATPEESVLGHLEGLRLLREKWGPRVAANWREGDFDAPIRYEIGREFHVHLSPGSHETVAGVDFRLHWEGTDDSGELRNILLAVVGVVRRRDGFGITLTQGGSRLTEIKIDRNGRKTDLLKLTQKRFGPDPRAWLVEEVIRSLRRDYGDPPIYWLRAERRAPLYGHVADPDALPSCLFGGAGLLSFQALRERVMHSPSEEASRLSTTIRRLDDIARSLGFCGVGDESWWVLPRRRGTLALTTS
ncbi:MAG TPA: hypothetical protein VLJ37_03505 [bacterium]|nr:hypothetical protein [bacterium]